MDREQTIDRLWESSNHGTRREDVVAAFEAGVAAEREQMRALIAAAPALLEALQDTFAMLDESLLRDTFGSDGAAPRIATCDDYGTGERPLFVALERAEVVA